MAVSIKQAPRRLRSLRRKPAPDSPVRPAEVLGLTTKHQLGSGYPDPVVDGMAATSGGASINDNSIWGGNADQVRVVEELNAAGAVRDHLIGHAVRTSLSAVSDDLAKAIPAARRTESSAMEAVDERKLTQIEQEHLRQRIKREGLGFPHWMAHTLYYCLGLLALVFGDLAFIATAYELFGLSDAKLFGAIPYTDELHIGASASVLALVVMAHVAGKQLRAVLHDHDRRRREHDSAKHALLPEPSRTAMSICGVCTVVAIVLLWGIASIRTGFLAQKGIDAQALAFAAIQLGIFAAAIALAMVHAHPYGRAWIDQNRLLRRSTDQMDESCEAHDDQVARVNGLLGHADTLLAQAGHHLGASRRDVMRQVARLAWVAQIHYPEPVAEYQLLPDELPLPDSSDDATTLAFLLGIADGPRGERMSTERVNAHREAARQLVERLRHIWLIETWPAVDEAAATTSTVDIDGHEVEVVVPARTAVAGNGAVGTA